MPAIVPRNLNFPFRSQLRREQQFDAIGPRFFFFLRCLNVHEARALAVLLERGVSGTPRPLLKMDHGKNAFLTRSMTPRSAGARADLQPTSRDEERDL